MLHVVSIKNAVVGQFSKTNVCITQIANLHCVTEGVVIAG